MIATLGSTTGATTYTATHVADPSGAANTLLLAHVIVTGGAGEEPPDFSGYGIAEASWGIVQSTLHGATIRFITYQANGSGAATTPEFSVSGYGSNRTGCGIIVVEYTGVKTTTIGVGAGSSVVQVAAIASGTGTTGTTGTLAAYSHADNRPVTVFEHVGNEATTPDSTPGTWTETGDINYNNPACGMEAQFNPTDQETVGTATWATSSAWRARIMELNGDTGGGGAATYPGWEGAGWWFRNEEWARNSRIPLLGDVVMLGEAREEGLIAA